MEARTIGRPRLAARLLRDAILLLAAIASGGCQIFQPAGDAAGNKPAPPKKHESSEIVRTPASQPSPGAAESDESANAIVQWARNAMKARSAGKPNETAQAADSAADAAPPDASETVYEAVIPVSADPRLSTASPTRPARDQIVPRDRPHRPVTSAPVHLEKPPEKQPEKTAAPIIGEITVRAAAPDAVRAPILSPTVVANAPGEAASGESLQNLLSSALSEPGDATFREQLDRKMLLVVKGDYERAREPFTLASDAQQALGRRLLEALIAIREGNDGDPGQSAAAALHQINALRESLTDASDLNLPVFSICRAVRGFGQYEPIEPPRFVSGRENEFVAYCEIRDFASSERDGTYVSNFKMKIAILHGRDEVHSVAADDIVDKCRAKRSDCFLSPLVRLPASLAPGDYVARITVHDKIAGKVAEKIAKFRIVERGS
ncbi:MAG: hypothetical protein HZB38_09025 [Planctomycetes bacterium]|nr:hypothetical protein [Planctomycetota bacterium]